MTKHLYEINRLTNRPTGYRVYMPDPFCIENNNKRYICTHEELPLKLTDNKNYRYLSNASSCLSITDEESFYNCLNSANNTLNIDLHYNAIPNNKIVLTDRYDYTKFNNLDVNITTVKQVNNLALFGQGLSSEQYVTLELSGTMIYFNSLNISGVNLYAHDSSTRAITLDSNLTITNGNHIFTNNMARDDTTIGYGTGGAISAPQGVTNFIDASITFRNNSSKYGGGAINTSAITFLDSSITFTGNYAEGGGGAIYVMTITNKNSYTVFQDNSATDLGGAIYTSSFINISNGNSVFQHNSSTKSGGAIYCNSGIKFTDSSITFSGNRADTHTGSAGGAICLLDNLTISNSNFKFEDNYSLESGGAIFAGMDSFRPLNKSIINFIDSSGQFNDNSSYNDGGAIKSKSINFVDSSIQFNNNTCTKGLLPTGGAISVWDMSFISSNIQFNNNNSTHNGGAIFVVHNLLINNGIYKFNSNKAPGQYGTIIQIYNQLIIDQSYNSNLQLDITDNSSTGPVLYFNSFNNILSGSYPMNHIYNFYNNTSSIALIDFTSEFAIYGGKWDFSNNTSGGHENITTIFGTDPNNSIIRIKQADISFDQLLYTIECSADVKKGINSDDNNYYSIYRTTDFSGSAAKEISANRGN